MLLNSVSITYGRKVNLGDYNNANIEVTIGADVELGDDLHEVMQELWTMAKANVRAQVLPLLAKGKETSDTPLGLSNGQPNGITTLGTPTVGITTNGNGHS